MLSIHRTSTSLVVVAVLLLLVAAWPAQAAITGSAHDFSAAGWNATSEICIVCHTPHNADSTVAGIAPLWNHELTVSTFTPYSSATLNATVGQPGGVSILCLSCHDGSVALDSFGGAAGGTPMSVTTALLGTDLTNDHPVSFTYDSALYVTDGELVDPGLGGTGISPLPLFGVSSNQLECATCHDVHNNGSFGKMLRMGNTNSALCLTCHAK